MGYLIYRTEKVKSAGEIGGREAEMNRTKADVGRFVNSDIDWTRTDTNYDFKITHDWEKAVKDKCAELGCAVKKDSVLVLDHFITASPEWMQAQDEETKMRFFEDAKQWIVDTFCGGDESLLLSCRIHRDETTDHLCASTMPIVKNAERSEEELAALTRKPRQKAYSLNAKKIMGSRADYSARQQDIEDKIGRKYGLQEREVREPGQAKKHRSTQQCKLDAVREELQQAEEQAKAAKEKAEQYQRAEQAAKSKARAEHEKAKNLEANRKRLADDVRDLTKTKTEAKKAAQDAQEACQAIQHDIRAKSAELGILQAKTESELHKQTKALRQEVQKAPGTNIFGKRKAGKDKDCLDVTRDEYERLEGKVDDVERKVDYVKMTSIAGDEALEKLRDLIQNEQAHINAEALRLAQVMLEKDAARISANKQKEKELADRAAALSLQEGSLAEKEKAFEAAVEKGVKNVLKQLDVSIESPEGRFIAYLRKNYPEIMACAERDFDMAQSLKRLASNDLIKQGYYLDKEERKAAGYEDREQ